jgi:hypothetical protein
MAIETRIIRPATFELDRHDIKRAPIVSAARARVYPDTAHPNSRDFSFQAVPLPKLNRRGRAAGMFGTVQISEPLLLYRHDFREEPNRNG